MSIVVDEIDRFVQVANVAVSPAGSMFGAEAAPRARPVMVKMARGLESARPRAARGIYDALGAVRRTIGEAERCRCADQHPSQHDC